MITAILILVVSLVLVLLFFGAVVQLLSALVVGLVAGVAARWLIPGEQYMEWWKTALLGITGSLLSGVLGAVIDVDLGILGAIAGAVLVLFVIGRMRAARLICIGAAVVSLSGCWSMGINQQRSGQPRDRAWAVYPWAEAATVATQDGQPVPWYSMENKQAAIGVQGKIACW